MRMGWGGGRGMGRGMGMGQGAWGATPSPQPAPPASRPSTGPGQDEEEIVALKQTASELRKQLAEVMERLEKLEPGLSPDEGKEG